MRPGAKKFTSALLLFASVWLCARFVLPLLAPFVLGAGLALAAEPMVGFLHKRLHVPRSVSTGIGVRMAFCFLTMAVLLVCAFLLREIRLLTGVLPNLEQAAQSGFSLIRSWMLDITSHAPKSVQPLLQENVGTLFSDGTALLDKGTGYLLGLAGNLLSHVPDSALSLGTAIISAFLFSAKLPRIRRWLLRRISRERWNAIVDAGRRIKRVLGRWLVAQGKLTGVTFVLLLLGFVVLGIPYALLWALGVCLVDAFPVLGTGTILLPWALVYFLQADSARAIGLVSLYVTVTLVRSALEPKLLGRHLGLDPLVTLMVMYAGYKLWGIGGMLLAPILAVIAIQILPERRQEA